MITLLPPAMFKEFTHLRSLSLRNNKIKAIPDNFGSMTQLTRLDGDANNLTALPLRLPTSLRELTLSGNRLSFLPQIFTLTSLTSLNLSKNQMATLPLALHKLEGLREINLSRNVLITLAILPVRERTLAEMEAQTQRRKNRVSVGVGVDVGVS